MKYLLISPHKLLVDSNAGWSFITAGIMNLLKQADKDAEFETFDGFDNMEWQDAKYFSGFQWVVICGNPRYDLGKDVEAWLYVGMFKKLSELQKLAGFKVLDAWQGSGVPLGMERSKAISSMQASPRNKKIVDLLKEMNASVITRDALTQTFNQVSGLPSIELPCSSYFAPEYYLFADSAVSFELSELKRKVVIARNLDGYDGAKAILRTLSRTHEIIATKGEDAEYCARENIRHTVVWNPRDLCLMFLECEEIISFRLHVVIPSAAIAKITQARLFYSAIDSRGETCRAFGIPFEDYREGIIGSRTPGVVKPPIEELRLVLQK